MSLFSTFQEQTQPLKTATGGIVLTLSCPDQRGIVHTVSGVLMEHDYNIVESHEFHEPRDGMFFMRVKAEQEPTELANPGPLEDTMCGIAERFGMTWRVVPA